MATSSTHNGWRFDRANGRLDFYYRGTRVGSIDASGLDTAGSEIVNNVVQTAGLAAGAVTAAKLSTNLGVGYIPLPLSDWRLIASNDIPAIAVASGNGGNLGVDTAPLLQRVNAATDKQLRISWVANGVVEVTQKFMYPPDLDDTAAVVVNILSGMGGATDTPVLGVNYFEGVGDTNAGGNTAAHAAAVTHKTVSIAAGDIGAYPQGATVGLIPAAHGNDALYVYGTWITYTRKD